MNKAEFSKYLNPDKSPDAAAIPRIKELLEKYPFSAFLHMFYAKTLKIAANPGAEKYFEMAAIHLNDRKKFFRYINDIPEEVVIQQQIPAYKLEFAEGEILESTGMQYDLVNKFLNEKPSFSMRSEVLDDSEESVYDPEIISEPLAEIFLKQGKADIAINTYEKLSLKYPEKSSYFAARIEKIKKNY
jgi:hypothetical protein